MNNRDFLQHVEIPAAAQRLAAAVHRIAHRRAKYLGFSYIETEDAPNSWEELQRAWAESCAHTRPLPVYSGASDKTIYGSRGANWAFRFWHDVVHCQHGLSFSTADELTTGLRQLNELELVEGYGPNTLEYQMLYLDTIGQVEYFAEHGGFIEDQRTWMVEQLLARHSYH